MTTHKEPDGNLHVLTPLRTVGKSGKAILAAALPAAGGLVAVAIEWITAGHLDQLELRTALTAVAAAALAGLGGWLGHPGEVEVAVPGEPGGKMGQHVPREDAT